MAPLADAPGSVRRPGQETRRACRAPSTPSRLKSELAPRASLGRDPDNALRSRESIGQDAIVVYTGSATSALTSGIVAHNALGTLNSEGRDYAKNSSCDNVARARGLCRLA